MKERESQEHSSRKDINKVEPSSQEVSITSRTRRSIIYHSLGETTKLEEEPYIKAPTKKSRLKEDLHHQASPLEEGNLKDIKIQGRQAIKLSKEEENPLHLIIYQISTCPLLDIFQCLLERKAINW